MKVLEQRLYRNPLDILLDAEKRSCKGCRHEHTERLWGKDYTICKVIKPDGKRRHHGKKCKDYSEKK